MALKPPEFYAQMYTTAIGVPPGSSHAASYLALLKTIAQMFADADVVVAEPPPTGLSVTCAAPGTLVPVLGKGKLE